MKVPQQRSSFAWDLLGTSGPESAHTKLIVAGTFSYATRVRISSLVLCVTDAAVATGAVNVSIARNVLHKEMPHGAAFAKSVTLCTPMKAVAPF